MDIHQLPPGSPVELRMVKGKNEEKVDETNADNTYLSSLFDIISIWEKRTIKMQKKRM